MELCLSNQRLVQWHLCATGLGIELFHIHQCSDTAATGRLCKRDEQRASVTLLNFIQVPFFPLDNNNYLAIDTETELLQLWFIYWSQVLQSSPQRMHSSISMAWDLQLFSKSVVMKHQSSFSLIVRYQPQMVVCLKSKITFQFSRDPIFQQDLTVWIRSHCPLVK